MNEAKQAFLTRYGSEKHLNSIMENSDPDVYSAMWNPSFNHTHIQKLIDHNHGALREVVQHPYFHEKVTPEQMNHMASDRRTATAFSCRTMTVEPHHIDSMLNVLDKHYNSQLAGNLATMYKATPEQLHRMAEKDDPHMNQALSRNKKLPEEYIPRFINSSIVLNRMNITGHPKLQPKHMETLANDENQFVRSALVKRKDLPTHIIHKLAKDESPSVRSEIFVHHYGK